MYWLFTTMCIYFSPPGVIYIRKLDLIGTWVAGGRGHVFITVNVIAALGL